MEDQTEEQKALLSSETILKQKFAIELLKTPQNPYKAAIEAFGDGDTAKALRASRYWVNDQSVLAFQKEYLEKNGDECFLPSKGEIGRRVYSLYEDSHSTVKEKLDSLKFYAQLMNYIDTSDKVTVNQNNQKIMVVANYGDDEEWEKRVAEQQRKLLGSNDD